NIDILGTDSIEADAEIAAVGAEFFRAIGLTPAEVKLQINNRKLMSEQIAALGIGDIKPALKLIDRIDKLSPQAWADYGVEQGLTTEQTAGLRTLLGDKELWRKSDELIRFFEILDAMGVGEYFEYEPGVVRGLDYYTRTVMEARDRDGEFRAILGGGRYDNLVAEVGGDRISGVGYAMGDMVIGLVAAKYGKIPAFAKSPASVLVTVFGPGSVADSLRAARLLREAGIPTETYPDAVKLDRQLKYADAQGIRFAVIIGPDETSAGKATVKDLQNRAQFSVNLADLPGKLREILDSPGGS
ncbi:MAG: HisS family protein, partial [Chloroflexota bacterium]